MTKNEKDFFIEKLGAFSQLFDDLEQWSNRPEYREKAKSVKSYLNNNLNDIFKFLKD